MSLICLKLICLSSHLRIKSKPILMICEALCDLALARLSHFTSHCSPLSCSNLSTLRLTHPPTLHHLVMIYPHWLFCFSDTGSPCADRQVAQCIISGGHSVGCRVNDAPGNVQPGSPAHTHQPPSHCRALAPAAPPTCMSTCGFFACLALSCPSTQQLFHKALRYTRQNWLPNLQGPQ